MISSLAPSNTQLHIHTLTESDKSRSNPGNPATLCGAKEVITTQLTLANLILFSPQKRWVESPTFNKQLVPVTQTSLTAPTTAESPVPLCPQVNKRSIFGLSW